MVQRWIKGRRGVRYRSYPHSLGTLTCCMLPDGNLSIIDGQQRITTMCLLLSSVRDFLSRAGIAPELRKEIDQTLFPAGRANGCVVRPTYFDRASFERCVNGTSRGTVNLTAVGKTANASPAASSVPTSASSPDDHVSLVGKYFDKFFDSGLLLKRIFPDRPQTPEAVAAAARQLVGAVLDQFSLLWFKMDNSANAQSAYARLAMRAAAIESLRTDPNAGGFDCIAS